MPDLPSLDDGHRFIKIAFLNAVLLVLMVIGGCGNNNNGNGSGNSGGGSSGTPTLAASVTTQGNFSSGQQNASYTIQVNNTGTGATSGTVTVADPPTGFTVTGMTGTNWTCTLSTTTCTYTLSVAAGQAFPPIVVTGNVTATNGTPVSIGLSLSGGGISSTVTSTPTVPVAAPSLAITSTHSGNFTAGQQGATYTVTVKNGTSAGATNAKVTVTDTVPSGETLVSMSGTGWTCAGGANTCTRSDALATGASYPAITVTVNVAANAASPQVNQVSVSGGGITGSVSANDSTAINLGPDVSITASNVGNFGAGTNGAFTIAVANLGDAPTTGAITMTDSLPSQFGFVSATGNGWTCGASGQVVTCTNSGPIAAGTSASSVALTVSVSSSASGNISDTATVATTGDTNASNNSSTDTVNVLGTGSLPASLSMTVPGASPTGVIYAGGNSETVTVTVANDQAADMLTPTMTLAGAACTQATCGTIGSFSGTSTPYTATYTPPTSVATATTITLTVTSSLPNSFPATVNFTVYPAGARVVRLQGVATGSGPKNLMAYVYNDSGGTTGVTAELLGAGYGCPPVSGMATVCGTLMIGTKVAGTTISSQGTTGIALTQTPLTYTPPTANPNPPFDRPMILAVSNADPTALAQDNFVVAQNSVLGFFINPPSRLATVLTGGATTTLTAAFSPDTGVNKTATWALTDANGAACQPNCGTLGTPSYIWNGTGVTTTIPYTPPATVPSGAADNPIITMISVDPITGRQAMDNFQFQINNGTCGTGNNSLLNGQYAFLLQGGSATQGYVAFIGSFTANGTGGITGGDLDTNKTIGPATGLSILSAGSSYSIGPDNRGCLTLANSSGGSATFRIAVGTVSGGVATQGRVIRFDDNTGAGQRLQGLLIKQDPTAFASTANGSYAFGYQGIQSAGARLAVAGVVTADGAGNLTNFDTDAIDGQGNIDSNDTSGSGTYSTTVDGNGRGTGSINVGAPTDTVFYIVNASEYVSMTTDALSPGTPILSGDNRQRTTTSYSSTSFDGNSYVFYETGVDPASGGNATLIGEAQFSTGGADTAVVDTNSNGTVDLNQTSSDSFTIASNGRAVDMQGQFVLYPVGTGSAFVLGTDSTAAFGFSQQQASGPFSSASISGQFFFGGGAPTAGGEFDSGTANFNTAGAATLDLDDQQPEDGVSSETLSFSYSIASTSTGSFTMTSPGIGSVAGFIVSNSQFVFMSTGTDPSNPELITGQQ